eukprot:551166-Pyramimonas_sp.AAC.1
MAGRAIATSGSTPTGAGNTLPSLLRRRCTRQQGLMPPQSRPPSHHLRKPQAPREVQELAIERAR